MSRAWAPFLAACAVLNYLSPRTICWHIRRGAAVLGPLGKPALAGALFLFWRHIVNPKKWPQPR